MSQHIQDAELRIEARSIYRGPHLYSATPMVRIELDIGAFEQSPSNTIKGFNERLVQALPGLANHGCCYHEAGGFLRRLEAGTWIGHVIEHVALELQNEAGFAVTRGKTRSVRGRAGVYNVMYEYKDEAVGLHAGRLAIELVGALAGLGPDRIQGLNLLVAAEKYSGAEAARAQFMRFAARRKLGPTTTALVQAARKRGIPVARLDDRSLLRFGWGRAQHIMRASITGRTSHVAVDTAGNKHLTKTLLLDAALPAPRGALVSSADEAVEAATRLGAPVVVKPLDGNHGRAVRTNLSAEADIRAAFEAARLVSRRVIVERFIRGRDYRVLVINGDIAAVAERAPARIIGDGARSIEELIAIQNADPRRGRGHANVLTRIELDQALTKLLAAKGLALDDVPVADELIVLREAANISTGGEAIDRTDEIHPDNAQIARRAAALIGLDIAGIDIVCPDIARPMRDAGAIVEINAAPGFRMHLAPSKGRRRDVAGATLRYLYPRGDGRIPVIAITGTNGKSTTVRMVAHILRQTGVRVGMTCTSGVYIDEERIWKGDASGPRSARLVLGDPTVDVAVLETARGGMLREGLAFDRCTIGAVLNVSADHLGVGGVDTLKDLAAVKSIIAESVARTGVSVLNADDPLTREMARHAGGHLSFFSMDEALSGDFLRTHIDRGGRAGMLEARAGRQALALYADGRRQVLMPIEELPSALNGLARFNVENALAAGLIAHAHGVPLRTIRLALANFTSSYEQNPGRLNVYDEHGFRIIMDYAHNPAALNAIVATVSALSPRYNRRLATISTPGDRRDEDIRQMGRIAGRGFDRVIFRERPDTRGRSAGEVIALLAAGARESGMSESDFECVGPEEEATALCLSSARPGDLVVLTPTDLEATWAQIKSFSPVSAAIIRPHVPDVAAEAHH